MTKIAIILYEFCKKLMEVFYAAIVFAVLLNLLLALTCKA